jgi:hypothetical protein
MTAESDFEDRAGRAQESLSDDQLARRRLLRGSVAAAPVVLSVVSTPVMATTGTGSCTSASAFASINTSRAGAISTTCGGQPPSYWVSCAGTKSKGYADTAWPTGYKPTDFFVTHFTTAFSGCTSATTLLDVLNLPDTSGIKCSAKLTVAALLSAGKGAPYATTVMDPARCKTLWKQYAPTASYSPTAGVMWYPDTSTPAGMGGGWNAWLSATMK